ncbi:D-aminoacyl-tRNA deacylase [Brevibacillus sp. SYSU BS000544]|uniref:D-aminoacyl-tRNA deacylase n=1 Tax=Brevibacillus sp. SYSU BS000544 TaxID=3416443 RepID=UPI003CE5C68F
MRVVVQRSKQARVEVEDTIVGQIEHGLVLLVGITHEDTEKDVEFIADKIANLRIFADDEEKMNHSVIDTGGQILSISQFTLYGDCRKGRRPNFMAAARPEQAEVLYEMFNQKLREKGLIVATGKFGAMMQVHLINDGPVTLIVESSQS